MSSQLPARSSWLRGAFVPMKLRFCFSSLFLLPIGFAALQCISNAPAQTAPQGSSITNWKAWPSRPPDGAPFPASTELTGIAFTGKHAQNGHADTWYPSWAADGNLYSPWTDGEVNGVKASSAGAAANTGFA